MPAKDDQKRSEFIKHYVQLGNGTQAAIAAGVPSKSAAVTASRWLRNPEISAQIRAEMEQQVKNLAPMALKVLAELIGDTNLPPSIRLAASRDVLDRAQYVAPKRVEAKTDLSVSDFRGLKREDLERLVASRVVPNSA